MFIINVRTCLLVWQPCHFSSTFQLSPMCPSSLCTLLLSRKVGIFIRLHLKVSSKGWAGRAKLFPWADGSSMVTVLLCFWGLLSSLCLLHLYFPSLNPFLFSETQGLQPENLSNLCSWVGRVSNPVTFHINPGFDAMQLKFMELELEVI